jgi:DNA repair protein RecO
VSLVETPAILLRAHPYSETSKILRFYSRDMGVVAVVARGVRKTGGRGGGGLSTLAEGILSFHHRDSRELQTFRDFAASRYRRGLARDPRRFAGAAVLGEMVLQHAGSDPNPSLYARLSGGLDALEGVDGDLFLRTLLMEMWALIGELGYTPSVLHCVGCGEVLGAEEMGRFDFAEGGIRCPRCQSGDHGPRLGPVARIQLAGLVKGSFAGDLARPLAHLRLASDFITYHISGGYPLRSMEVLVKLIPEDDA